SEKIETLCGMPASWLSNWMTKRRSGAHRNVGSKAMLCAASGAWLPGWEDGLGMGVGAAGPPPGPHDPPAKAGPAPEKTKGNGRPRMVGGGGYPGCRGRHDRPDVILAKPVELAPCTGPVQHGDLQAVGFHGVVLDGGERVDGHADGGFQAEAGREGATEPLQ